MAKKAARRTIRLLIGGSPCQNWSVARRKGRETTAEGIGWELFKNFLIAKEKFRPDFFLYENNKSMANAIKEQITEEFGVGPQMIDAALVSAQSRKRYYWHNFSGVPQPEDRGILLKDVLETCGAGFVNNNEKAYCLTATYDKSMPENLIRRQRTQIAEPLRIGTIESKTKDKSYDSKQYRVYSPEAKSVTLCGEGGGVGAKTGLYATPTSRRNPPVYTVQSGMCKINGKPVPIKLPDGEYTIRKLTPNECEALMTMPQNYTEGVANTNRYRMLGNGWVAEVLLHIFSHGLAGVSRNCDIEILSMYDGMGTGRYCFDRLGFRHITYKATEIDKWAVQISAKNYPDIIQLGDAFQVREGGWEY